MWYVTVVNNNGATAMFSLVSYDEGQALFHRMETDPTTIFVMWGNSGGDVINTYVSAEIY